MELEGRVALVTGGPRRIGRAIALRLADAGCDVAITYRSHRAEARKVVDAIVRKGRRAWAIHTDLSHPDGIPELRNTLLSLAGRLDVLIHNASAFDMTPFGAITPEAWHAQMSVNAMAPVLITQAFADELADNGGGRVVHMLDIHAIDRPRKGYVAYLASKAALAAATSALALEMAPCVTVNAVAPGVVAWAKGMSPEEKGAYLSRVPLGRAGIPEDAAAAVLYLVRDADYVTGQVIRVDGGRWLN